MQTIFWSCITLLAVGFTCCYINSNELFPANSKNPINSIGCSKTWMKTNFLLSDIFQTSKLHELFSTILKISVRIIRSYLKKYWFWIELSVFQTLRKISDWQRNSSFHCIAVVCKKWWKISVSRLSDLLNTFYLFFREMRMCVRRLRRKIQ